MDERCAKAVMEDPAGRGVVAVAIPVERDPFWFEVVAMGGSPSDGSLLGPFLFRGIVTLGEMSNTKRSGVTSVRAGLCSLLGSGSREREKERR